MERGKFQTMADQREQNFKVCVCGAALKVLNQNGLVTRREWTGFVSDIHYCLVCDHVQFHPIPPKSVLDNFYGAEFFRAASVWGEAGFTADHSAHYWSDTSGHLPHITFLDLLRRLRKENFRYGVPAAHDFGCGYGSLLRRLAEFGFDASGSDLDEIAVRDGKRQHLAMSLGGVAELGAQKEQYDLITCYHCLEHLPAPYEFFLAANRALRPGGLLALAFPSGGYGPARLDYFGKFDWCFFPAHLHYFSPRSLRKAAETTGFEITYLETQSYADEQLDWAARSMSLNGHQFTDQEGLHAFLDRNLLGRDLRAVMCRYNGPTARSSSGPVNNVHSPRVTCQRNSSTGANLICSLKSIESRCATMVLTLTFAASFCMTTRYKIVLHAQCGEPGPWAEDQPFHNLDFWPYPNTREWSPGMEVELKVPFDLAPGTYRLRTGLYDVETNSVYERTLLQIGEVFI